MPSVKDFPKIKAVRSFIIGGVGSGMPSRLLHSKEELAGKEFELC